MTSQINANLARRIAGALSIAAIASLVGLPATAQTSSSDNEVIRRLPNLDRSEPVTPRNNPSLRDARRIDERGTASNNLPNLDRSERVTPSNNPSQIDARDVDVQEVPSDRTLPPNLDRSEPVTPPTNPSVDSMDMEGQMSPSDRRSGSVERNEQVTPPNSPANIDARNTDGQGSPTNRPADVNVDRNPQVSPSNPSGDIDPSGQVPPSNRPGTVGPSSQVSPSNRTSEVSRLDEEFFRLAYQGNNAEIQTSQLALQRSQDQNIRQYAQRMINEHTRANELLTQNARQLNISLPSERVDPLNQAISERLSQLSGSEFNQAYVDGQSNAHLRAIALYRTQASQGEVPALRSYATSLLPNIEGHYEMASVMLRNSTAGSIDNPRIETQPVR